MFSKTCVPVKMTVSSEQRVPVFNNTCINIVLEYFFFERERELGFITLTLIEVVIYLTMRFFFLNQCQRCRKQKKNKIFQFYLLLQKRFLTLNGSIYILYLSSHYSCSTSAHMMEIKIYNAHIYNIYTLSNRCKLMKP